MSLATKPASFKRVDFQSTKDLQRGDRIMIDFPKGSRGHQIHGPRAVLTVFKKSASGAVRLKDASGNVIPMDLQGSKSDLECQLKLLTEFTNLTVLRPVSPISKKESEGSAEQEEPEVPETPEAPEEVSEEEIPEDALVPTVPSLVEFQKTAVDRSGIQPGMRLLRETQDGSVVVEILDRVGIPEARQDKLGTTGFLAKIVDAPNSDLVGKNMLLGDDQVNNWDIFEKLTSAGPLGIPLGVWIAGGLGIAALVLFFVLRK